MVAPSVYVCVEKRVLLSEERLRVSLELGVYAARKKIENFEPKVWSIFRLVESIDPGTEYDLKN